MAGFLVFIKQLLILLAGLYLIRLVGTSEIIKSLNATVWFIAVLCGVIGGLTIQAFTSVDCREQGQTQHEYTHQTACGFVRDDVTTKYFEVTCFYCKRTKEFEELENYNGEGL